MTRVRFRIKLGDRTSGVPLDELGSVAREAKRFFGLVSQDARIDPEGEWIAEAPRRGSFAFDVVLGQDIPAKSARSLNAKVRRLNAYKPRTQKAPKNVSRDTVVQYAKLAEGVAQNRSVHVGLYETPDERTPSNWGVITKDRSSQILEAMDESIVYYGSVQGTIHSLNIGSSPSFFQIREVSTKTLVKCVFKPEQYSHVIDGLKRSGCVLLVSGHASASREYRSITSLEVERIDTTDTISETQFEQFAGSMPGLTGNLSTEEYIDEIRRDET